MEAKKWEDILGMVMDFENNRKTAGELMDAIAEHCQLSFKAGRREVVSDIVKLMDCRLKAETFAIKVSDYCEAQLKEWGLGD